MLDTFKARLKAKFSGVNLSQKRIDAIADRLHKKFPELTEEADHDAKLDDLNDVQAFSEIAAYDDWQRAKESREAAKKEKTEDKKSDSNHQQQGESETDKLLKELLQKVNKLESKETQSTIQQKVSKHEKLKDVPSSYYSKWQMPENEEGIDGFVENVTKEYGDFTKDLTDKGFAVSTKPASGGAPPNSKAVSPEIKQFAEKQAAKDKQTNH